MWAWELLAFIIYGLISCVSEGPNSEWMLTHNVRIGTLDLHGLMLCVSEDLLSEWMLIHIVGMGTFHLHGLILCVSEDLLSEWMLIYIVGIETFDVHGLTLCVCKVFFLFCFVITLWTLMSFEHHIQNRFRVCALEWFNCYLTHFTYFCEILERNSRQCDELNKWF